MIAKKKINSIQVECCATTNIEKEKIKGYDLIPALYANIALCASTGQGKTSVINTLIRHCCGDVKYGSKGEIIKTKLFLFVPTITHDDAWVHICQFLDDNGFDYEPYDDLEPLKSVIDELLHDNPIDEKEPEDTPPANSIDQFRRLKPNATNKKPRRLIKKFACKYMFIFDDLGDTTRDPHIYELVKFSRHLKSKIIISSQYSLNTQPSTRCQIRIWMVFQGLQPDKIRRLYEIANPKNCSLDEFIMIYKAATDDNYSFLYIDTLTHQFRRCFNTLLELRK